MASSIRLPVNLPYYWKMVVKIATAESGFIDAGNNLLNDLFFDILSYYQNCDIMTAQIFRKFNFRVIKLSYYDTINDAHDDDLFAAGFCVPCEPTDPPGYVLKVRTGAHKIASLTDTFYHPKFELNENNGYSTGIDGVTYFENNIFYTPAPNENVPYKLVPYHYENYVQSTGNVIKIKTCYLIASDIAIQDSPLYNNYGALVYHRNIDIEDPGAETEFEYRNKILGLFYLMYNGMTPTALNAAVNVMCGYPVTLHNNEIIKNVDTENNIIITEYRDLSGRTKEEEYTLIPSMPLSSEITVGKMCQKFTPLYSVITIQSSNTDPNWVHDKTLPEEIYKTDYDAHKKFDLETTLPLVYQESVPSGEPYIRYDTPGMVPFDINGTLSVYTWTYYVWNHFLKNAICKITIAMDTSAQNVADILSMDFLDSVLPIWLYFIIDQTVIHVDELNTQSEISPGYIKDSYKIESTISL